MGNFANFVPSIRTCWCVGIPPMAVTTPASMGTPAWIQGMPVLIIPEITEQASPRPIDRFLGVIASVETAVTTFLVFEIVDLCSEILSEVEVSGDMVQFMQQSTFEGSMQDIEHGGP